MNIALITYCSPDFKELASLTLPNHTQYCVANGYEHLIVNTPRSKMGPAWDRIDAFRRHLIHYDYLLCVGVDTLFTNFRIKIESWIMEDTHVLFAKDWNGINDDVMLLKDDVWTREFLTKILMSYDDYKGHKWAEQGCIHDLAPQYSTIKTISNKSFNGLLLSEYDDSPEDATGRWEQGDFILHLCGMPMKRRLQLAPIFLGRVEQ